MSARCWRNPQLDYAATNATCGIIRSWPGPGSRSGFRTSRSRRGTAVGWKTLSGRCSLRRVRRRARRSSASLGTTAARISISRPRRRPSQVSCSKTTAGSRPTHRSMTARAHCSSATAQTCDYSARSARAGNQTDAHLGRRLDPVVGHVVALEPTRELGVAEQPERRENVGAARPPKSSERFSSATVLARGRVESRARYRSR